MGGIRNNINFLNNAIAEEDETPSGTVVIDETQVMLLVGGSRGGGVLTLNDNSTHEFKVSGMRLGGIGAHKIHLEGEVYDLNNIEDFYGTYFAAEAGVTAAKAGKGAIWMKNSKDVRLHLKTSEEKGIALSLGVEGFKIKK